MSQIVEAKIRQKQQKYNIAPSGGIRSIMFIELQSSSLVIRLIKMPTPTESSILPKLVINAEIRVKVRKFRVDKIRQKVLHWEHILANFNRRKKLSINNC